MKYHFEYAAEEWRPVDSMPEIEASSFGRIRRVARISIMPNGGVRIYASDPTFGVPTKAKKGDGHIRMMRYYRGIGNVRVARAVCEAFNGPPPFAGAVAMHLNGRSTDNRPSNLEWAAKKATHRTAAAKLNISIAQKRRHARVYQ